MNIASQLSHFLCDATHAFGFDDSNGESPESGDVFRAVASAYTTAVFIVVPIDDVVAAILDAPVAGSPYKTMQVREYRPVLLCKPLFFRYVLPEVMTCNLFKL